MPSGFQIGAASRGRAPLHPNLWQSSEFFWNFSLGDGPIVQDYSGHGRNGTITEGVGSNQFFDDVSPIHPGLRCLRRTGSGGHITGVNYPSFQHKAAEPFTVVCRFSVSNTASDDRSIFYFRIPGGLTQFGIRTDLSTAPSDIEVRHRDDVRISGNNNIELDTPYVLSVTNDGLESSSSLRLRIYDAISGELLSTQTGTVSGDLSNIGDNIWWIGANHSDTNDPLTGTHCGVYVYSRVLNDSEIQLFVDDWLAPFRAKRRIIGLVSAAAAVPVINLVMAPYTST